jgi:hypothetical protein
MPSKALAVKDRRAVRLHFDIDGIQGREDIVVTAGSDEGACVLAGIVFAQTMMQYGFEEEYFPERLFVSSVTTGFARTPLEKLLHEKYPGLVEE